MHNDYLQTQILLNDDELQGSSESTIRGKIIFTPQIDLSVEELGYQIILKASNLYLNRIIPLQKEVFFRNKVMKAGKDYSYEVEFTPHFSKSFSSKNLKLQPAIQTIVNLQTKSYLHVRNDYLKKMKLSTLTDTTELLWESENFSIWNAKRKYLIENEDHQVNNKNLRSWIYFFISAIISTLIIAPIQEIFEFQILPIVIFFLFGLIVFPQLYKNYILKSIGINVQQINENQFGIFLDLTKNWKLIQRVKAEYGSFGNFRFHNTHEEVPYGIDFYISPPIEKSKIKYVEENILDFQEVKYDFIFDLPKGNIPVTFDHPDASSYWEFKITVYFFLGLKSEFIKEIKVKHIPFQE